MVVNGLSTVDLTREITKNQVVAHLTTTRSDAMETNKAFEEARREVKSGVIEAWTTVVKVGLKTEGDRALGVVALINMMSVK